MTVRTKTPFEDEVRATQDWFDNPRFDGMDTAVFSASGGRAARHDPPGLHGRAPGGRAIPRQAARAVRDGRSITTFGPYSPGQGVVIKRMGIEGIYLGGWATSAKGSADEDPGPDLASYPLSQVPNEAAASFARC